MSEETGEQFPALLERPELIYIDEYYLKAFFRLSSSRQVGMGTGPIPLSEIILYCEWLEDQDTEEFIEVITHMDATYLEVKAEQDAAKSKK